jgi:hypothetical protein
MYDDKLLKWRQYTHGNSFEKGFLYLEYLFNVLIFLFFFPYFHTAYAIFYKYNLPLAFSSLMCRLIVGCCVNDYVALDVVFIVLWVVVLCKKCLIERETWQYDGDSTIVRWWQYNGDSTTVQLYCQLRTVTIVLSCFALVVLKENALNPNITPYI